MLIVNKENKHFNHKKSLKFKYGRMQTKIPSWLVCGSRGACLDCMFSGVKLPQGWDFFLRSSHISYNEDSDSLH